MFAYTITIRNTGTVPAQLISRHWVITDAQAWCRKCAASAWSARSRCCSPARRFEYTSGASIATPVGTMRGSYQMVAADGTRFEAAIPEFTLSVPRILH